MACSICPQGSTSVFIGTGSPVITWVRLVNLDKWELVANRTEAPKKRTSDTNGAAVKFCSDVLDWSVNLTTTLCESSWLYCDILADSSNPSIGVSAYWFLTWDIEYLPASQGGISKPVGVTAVADISDALASNERGIYFGGTVIPGGFGLDNTSSDPATSDWTIEVTNGPWFPECGLGNFSASTGEIP